MGINTLLPDQKNMHIRKQMESSKHTYCPVKGTKVPWRSGLISAFVLVKSELSLEDLVVHKQENPESECGHMNKQRC